MLHDKVDDVIAYCKDLDSKLNRYTTLSRYISVGGMMGWYYCTNHKKVGIAWRSGNRIKFEKCKCTMTKKESEKWAVRHKRTWVLPDGREIVKVQQEPKWEIKDA